MTDTLQDLARRLVDHSSGRWRWLAGSKLVDDDPALRVGTSRSGRLGVPDQGGEWIGCDISSEDIPDLADPPTVRNVLELLRETRPEAYVYPDMLELLRETRPEAYVYPDNAFVNGQRLWECDVRDWDGDSQGRSEGEAVARATLAEWDRLGAAP